MQLETNHYISHHNKVIMQKIKGYLKSTLRKREAHVAYDNMIKSEYMFFEYLNIKEEELKYKPKILIIQIILNLLLFGMAYYFLSNNLIYLMGLSLILIFSNWFILWSYSFISILKNKFKKRENKKLWLLLILFLPFTAFFYPDLKKVQIERQ
jgi:CDP-diglyceride synthetase